MKRAGKYIRMEEVFAVKKQDDPGKKGAGGQTSGQQKDKKKEDGRKAEVRVTRTAPV